MSVAKLCESLGSWEDGAAESPEVLKSDCWNEKIEIQVFTTTANGKNELEVEPNRNTIVDGVEVTYFSRLTKDHTHFSPRLLLGLRREILMHQKKPPLTPCKEENSLELNKQKETNNELIIHIHAWWNLVSVLSCAVAMWSKIPVVLSPRGMLTNYTQSNRNSFSKNLIHRLIGKKLLRYCHIHATSEHEKQDILAIVAPKSIKVIPNLVELGGVERLKLKEQSNETFHELTDGKRPFKLIFLSRIEEKKGLTLLFEALSIAEIDFTLTIAGSGNEDYIRSLKINATNLKIDHQIIWLGQVKNEDKFELLRKHDCMVLTSYNENFANVVIESLSVGTAVILSDLVGLSDDVIEHDLGWVTALDLHSISNCLKIAYQDADKRNKISKLAPQFISKNFNDKVLAQHYIKLYTDLANGRL